MHLKLEFNSSTVTHSPGIGEVSNQNLMVHIFLQLKLQYSGARVQIKHWVWVQFLPMVEQIFFHAGLNLKNYQAEKEICLLVKAVWISEQYEVHLSGGLLSWRLIQFSWMGTVWGPLQALSFDQILWPCFLKNRCSSYLVSKTFTDYLRIVFEQMNSK